MSSFEIEEFAKILIEQVRDSSIKSNDRVLLPTAGYKVAKRWKAAMQIDSPEKVTKILIPDIVDETIFYLLQAIDQGTLKISFTASNGKIVNLEKDGHGELAGWYMGSESWRAKYSKERFFDDFADLEL